jgi:hypothetical protein
MRGVVRLATRPSDRIGECFVKAGLPWSPLFGRLEASGRRAMPFAVTPLSIQTCRNLMAELTAPDLSIVRLVNSKIWSANARARAGFALGSVGFCYTEVIGAAKRILKTGPIILKEPFGVSGLGSVVVMSPTRLGTVSRVLRVQEDRGIQVQIVVEPLLNKRFDFSSHVWVGPNGDWRILGFQGMVNAQTRFVASRHLPYDDQKVLQSSDLNAALESIAKQLSFAGYFGPACIDGLITQDGSLVPILEVNARMSMGLMNLRLGEKLSPHGLKSTLLKIRVQRNQDGPSVLDALAADALLPRSSGTSSVLPVNSRAAVDEKGSIGLVLALLHKEPSEEAMLWNRALKALSTAGYSIEPVHLFPIHGTTYLIDDDVESVRLRMSH